MNRPLRLVSIFLFILTSLKVQASHIVGGDITVRRTAANTYEITSTFYRDCSSTTGYENPIYIGVYDKVTHVQQQVITSYISTQNTLTLGDACFTPSLCIEKAVYVTSGVILPNNPNGYYFSWLRCCRNASITNIVSPGDDGYVMYAEIADPSIANSTPVFSNIPDGYMCRNYSNTDNFTATDADGDVLVYSFSTPLSCNPTGLCSPLSPAPSGSMSSLPGPYGTISWQPGYSLAQPFGNSSISLNTSTGVLTTTPPNLGVYVISVKVEEYRGATKLGEIRRDFQFEVLNCSVLNLTVSPGNPACLGTTSTITAIGASTGSTYAWNSGQTTSAITVTPTASGSYNYTVTATNGTCISNTSTTLVINPLPTPSVATSGNACIGQYTTLTASGGSSYSWSNGSTSPTLSGVAAGTYTVWATNANGCVGYTTANINQPVVSNTYTWTGGGTTGANNWFDANNWGGCVPSCAYDAVIPGTPALNATNFPDIGNATASVRSFTLAATSSKLSFSNANGKLDVCGDLIQNGWIQTNNLGTIRFVGTTTQNYYKTSTANTADLQNVVLNNTSTTPPQLIIKEGIGYQDLSVGTSGSFTFTSGVVSTEGVRKIVIKNTASSAVSGHSQTSYVFGRLKRSVTTATSYDFPVGGPPVAGNAYPYQLMNIYFSAMGSVSELTASFENPTNANGTGLPVTEPSASAGQWATLLDNGGTNTGVGYTSSLGGVWTIFPNSYATAPTYSMTLYGRNYDNQGNYQHSILKRNTFCPGIWTASGSYNTSSVAGNIVTAARTSMSGFSQVAIAKTPVPLPVDLVAFDATCINNNTRISWVTASEMNNDYFTLERSCDEYYYQYETIATIKGAGNSSTLKEYSYSDSDETGGSCYYRLSQTDFNGQTVSFDPIAINCQLNADFNFIGVLPNPLEDEANVLFTTVTDGSIEMRVTDMLGQDFMTKDLQPEIGLNSVRINLSELPAGIYFVTLNNGNKVFIKKVIKKH